MFIIKNRIIFYTISAILIIASLISLSLYGLNQGIDFKGGTAIELALENKDIKTQNINTENKKIILENEFKDSQIRLYGDNGFLIKLKEISIEEHALIKEKIKNIAPEYSIVRIDTIGPVLGAELKEKSITSIVMVLIAIILFIAFAFRQVSKPVSSWKYGFAAIIALFHDVIIPIGFFSFMAHITGGYEIDALFVTALLVVLGFSIHDTIVVFDRIRENLIHNKNKTFENIVGNSISDTVIRSVNTSLTTILSLVAVYIWGPETTKNFAMALIIGIAAGTYSSIFIASSLLVNMAGKDAKKEIK